MQGHSITPDNNSIPYGYCQCGCGEKTGLAATSDRGRGHIKGQPVRYVVGHNRRNARVVVDGKPLNYCNHCEQFLELSMFGNSSRKKNGKTAICRNCVSQRDREYRQKNKDAIAEQNRVYRLKNKDRSDEYHARYRKENRDRLSQYHRQYYLQNKERVARRLREYKNANREMVRARDRNRRARKTAGGGAITAAEWRGVLSIFEGKCAKCGSDDDIHMDHVVPLAKGGKHSVDNVQPLCATCNLQKYTKTEDYRGKMYRPLALPLEGDQGAD